MIPIQIPKKGDRLVCTEQVEINEIKATSSSSWTEEVNNTFCLYPGQIVTVANSLYTSDPLHGKMILMVGSGDRALTFGSMADFRQHITVHISNVEKSMMLLENGEEVPASLLNQLDSSREIAEGRGIDI